MPRQQFTRWGNDDHRVYLLGNPVIYWGNLVCFALLAAAGLIYAALRQRGVLVRNAANLPICSWHLG